jgi:hypothetical protein
MKWSYGDCFGQRNPALLTINLHNIEPEFLGKMTNSRIGPGKLQTAWTDLCQEIQKNSKTIEICKNDVETNMEGFKWAKLEIYLWFQWIVTGMDYNVLYKN